MESTDRHPAVIVHDSMNIALDALRAFTPGPETGAVEHYLQTAKLWLSVIPGAVPAIEADAAAIGQEVGHGLANAVRGAEAEVKHVVQEVESDVKEILHPATSGQDVSATKGATQVEQPVPTQAATTAATQTATATGTETGTVSGSGAPTNVDGVDMPPETPAA